MGQPIETSLSAGKKMKKLPPMTTTAAKAAKKWR
jgi:hypothetical protein